MSTQFQPDCEKRSDFYTEQKADFVAVTAVHIF